MATPQEPAPNTVPIRTGWTERLLPHAGLRRVRESAPGLLQIVVAATGAYAFSHYVLGHPAPLLAGTVTISSLGLVRDARPRRVAETVLGMVVGILIAELLLLVTGVGVWQLALALALTLIVARFLSPQPSFAIAAAIQSFIVMAIPAAGPFERLADGVVGGVAAILVTALIPRNPIRAVTRESRVVFTAVDQSLMTLVQALSGGSHSRGDRGLQKARALQPLVDDWRAALESGVAIARISPFLRRQRFELARQERMCASMDLATRNLRVVARRVAYLCDDGTPRQVAADVLAEIARGARLISDSIGDISLEIPAREALRAVAAHLDPAEVLPGASIGDQGLIGALRPLVVDLLTAAGMPPDQARGAVPRV